MYSSIALLKVSENGIITNVDVGLSIVPQEGYNFVIHGVNPEIVRYWIGGKLVFENFVPKVIPKEGTELPELPQPPLTLEQKVVQLEEALKEQKQVNEDFKEYTSLTVDFLSEELFKTQTMKEGM